MTTKEQLHQLVDQLPEELADEAGRLLQALREGPMPEDRAWMDCPATAPAASRPALPTSRPSSRTRSRALDSSRTVAANPEKTLRSASG